MESLIVYRSDLVDRSLSNQRIQRIARHFAVVLGYKLIYCVGVLWARSLPAPALTWLKFSLRDITERLAGGSNVKGCARSCVWYSRSASCCCLFSWLFLSGSTVDGVAYEDALDSPSYQSVRGRFSIL